MMWSFLGLLRKFTKRKRLSPRRWRFALSVEMLEERCTPTTWSVTSISDTASDTSSLRWAFNHAATNDIIDLSPLCTSANATITLPAPM